MNRSIRTTIDVRCSVEHAFFVFTQHVDLWWPANHRKFEQSTLKFEAGVGERFVELGPNGEEVEHGVILTWDPPQTFSYTWRPGSIDKPTEVEVVFAPLDDITRVVVIHHEGDADLKDEWLKRSGGFQKAWADLLPKYEQHIEENHD